VGIATSPPERITRAASSRSEGETPRRRAGPRLAFSESEFMFELRASTPSEDSARAAQGSRRRSEARVRGRPGATIFHSAL